MSRPIAENAVAAEQQHEDQTGDNRRNGKRQVDQRDQQRAAAEAKFGGRPGGGETEHDVERHDHRRHRQRKANGGPGALGLHCGFRELAALDDGERGAFGRRRREKHREIAVEALGEGLDEDVDQRDENEHREKSDRQHDQDGANQRIRARRGFDSAEGGGDDGRSSHGETPGQAARSWRREKDSRPLITSRISSEIASSTTPMAAACAY